MGYSMTDMPTGKTTRVGGKLDCSRVSLVVWGPMRVAREADRRVLMSGRNRGIDLSNIGEED